MNSILQKIDREYIDAYKSKDQSAISVLRMLKSALKNFAIEKRLEINELETNDILKVISKEVKQRQDASSQYQAGGRQDLAQKEIDEISILNKYLPQQLSEDEISKILQTIIDQNGQAKLSEFGKIMSIAMPQFAGKADGNKVSQILRTLLQK